MNSIIVFGDSITFGRGDQEYRGGWVGRIKPDIESLPGYWCIFNLGIPGGETIEDTIKRIVFESRSRFKGKYEDDKLYLILSVGLNDTNINDDALLTSPTDFQKRAQDLINISKKLTNKVIWVGFMPVDEKSMSKIFGKTLFNNVVIEKYNQLLKAICIKESVPYLDLFSVFAKEPKIDQLISEDGIHPNTEGYDKMARYIKVFIKDSDFLKGE